MSSHRGGGELKVISAVGVCRCTEFILLCNYLIVLWIRNFFLCALS